MHEAEPPRVLGLHLLLARVPELGFSQPFRPKKLWRAAKDARTRARINVVCLSSLDKVKASISSTQRHRLAFYPLIVLARTVCSALALCADGARHLSTQTILLTKSSVSGACG